MSCNHKKIGYFPSKWKETQGIMLPKPKKDNKIRTNYRPISLLSCIGINELQSL